MLNLTIQNKRWILVPAIVLSMIWIALVFNERVEDNKRIRAEAAAQLAYNNTYELYQKQLSAEVEKWAIKTCASFNHSYANECVRLAVQEHHGFGYPHPTELCLLIAQAEQAVGLNTSSSALLQAAREAIGQTGCDPEKPSALPMEKPISGYLPKALLPPLGFAVVIWAGLATYSRISRLALANSILKPELKRRIRVIAAMLLIYEFWLGVWELFFVHSNSEGWAYPPSWLQDWFALAVIVPIGLMISFLVYRWATTKRS